MILKSNVTVFKEITDQTSMYLSTVFTVNGYSVYKNVHPRFQVFYRKTVIQTKHNVSKFETVLLLNMQNFSTKQDI